MRSRHAKAFTLIELLVVVAIIGILATLLMGALTKARSRADVAVAKSQISSISNALAMYEQDHGKYPRRSARTTPDLWKDDGPALYAALLNKPTQIHGGGQSSPYLENWKPDYIGLVAPATSCDPAAGNKMGSDGSQGTGVTVLPASDYDLVKTATYQQTHLPSTASALVLLDPWGNPYHYREWASIRDSTKDGLLPGGSPGPTSRVIVPAPAATKKGQDPITPVTDLPHSVERFDIWSNGPNGINEFGAPDSDDVTSWGQ